MVHNVLHKSTRGREAASHTGAMAGIYTAYEAAFSRAGIVRVVEMTDMSDCAELLAR